MFLKLFQCFISQYYNNGLMSNELVSPVHWYY